MAEHTKIVFVDTETTGLDPDRHEIWEVAAIVREIDRPDVEHLWQLPVDLGRADFVALNIGGFHERRWPDDDQFAPYGSEYHAIWVDRVPNKQGVFFPDDKHAFAKKFAHLTRGAHLVGAVPSFDEERLRKLLRSNGACPEWHYHIVDIEALIAGKLGFKPPWKSDDLGIAMGVALNEEDKHTALGDARWARNLYDAVYENKSLHDTAVKIPAHRS